MPLTVYKPEGNHFAGITRQVLFKGEGLPAELRYFEIEPGGHSTLERHEHEHVVLILSGKGRVLLGEVVEPVANFDLIHIPSSTWHQFRADESQPLGFLCAVPCERDRPEIPSEQDIEALNSNPCIADFVRY